MRILQRAGFGSLLALLLIIAVHGSSTASEPPRLEPAITVPTPQAVVDETEPGPAPTGAAPTGAATAMLSPFWRPVISQWADQIHAVAVAYQIDPDLIAAVVLAESHGDPVAVSRVGAVGLMGIMPVEAGFAWRPTTEALKDPEVNLDWGTAILADILRQSGGDLSTALAAYNGGWTQLDKRVPRTYAAEVLDFYGRAVAARSGVSPDIAAEWSVAVELTRGNIPAERLILDQEPVAELRKVGGHLLFDYMDENGQGIYVKAYAVPIRLLEPLDAAQETFGSSDTVEDLVLARLGHVDSLKADRDNAHVMLACLPIMERLNGRINTRWFRPSSCPASNR
jgi:hypothetical protein